MPLAGRGLLAALAESLQPELADRLKHPEARLGSGVVPPGEAVLHERSRVSSVSSSGVPAGEHTASAASRLHPPAKTASRRKHRPPIAVQEVVAPLDGAAQRALALRPVPRAACEQAQGPPKALQDGPGGKQPDAGRRELDGQGHSPSRAAQMAATTVALSGPRRIRGRPRAPARRRARPHRSRRSAPGSRPPTYRAGQRAHLVLALAGHPQGRAARHQHPYSGPAATSSPTRGAAASNCS